MRYLPTGAWMLKADAKTRDEIGIPSLVLMERAALEAVNVLEREHFCLNKILIVCGSGNNGGDGFAIGRLLKEKNHEVHICFVGDLNSMSEECRCQKNIAQKYGIPISTTIKSNTYTLVIDALFGVGLNRDVTGHAAEVISAMNQIDAKKVAVDIPSGICSSTGSILGVAFHADLTISFECEKLGCILFPGYTYCGRNIVVHIGVSTKIFEKEPRVLYTFDPGDLTALIPKRTPHSHKGTYGRILMITGSQGMVGAAYLSAKAAYIAGGGLVQIYTPKENQISLQQLLPDAILSLYEEYDEQKLNELLKWADVVCVGCGFSQSPISRKILEHVMNTVQVPCIVDADGLNLLAKNLSLLSKQERPLILTPHMKEMCRLLDCTMEELQANQISMIRKFTDQYGITCALKDTRTLVAKWDRQIFVNTAGNNGMAKAGSGDVLSGLITGLLAQKMHTYEATTLGVYLHARAGDEARKKCGVYSMMAEDLLDGVRICLKKTEESLKHETIQSCLRKN